MALIRADRVFETTATVGTGAYTLAGAVAGYQALSAVCSNADTVEYVATDGTSWEVGLGTWGTGGILTRTSVYKSSNSNNAVSWAAGSKDIFLDIPAAFFTTAAVFGGTVAGSNLSGTNTGDQTSVSGNAGTATALQTARAIGGVNFDGTAAIVPQTIQVADAAGDTTTFPMLAGAATGNLQPLTDAGLAYNATTNVLTVGGFSGPLTGNVTGDVTGNLTGNVTGNASGTSGSTTGNAATATALATARAIYGNNFDGTAALTQIIASTFGGTGNGFAKFSGPSTSEKTFTLPNSSETLLYAGGALGTPASGVGTNLTGTAASLTAGAATVLANARTIGGVSFNGSANIVPQTIESANEATDTTCFPLFITASGTQQLQPKNNTGLTFNSSTQTLNATALTSNGVAVATGSPVKTITKQIFTGNGTYTPTTGMVYCIVEAVAGGGGGGAADGASLFAAGAGGGQSGGFARSVLTAADIGASKAVVIGAGGAGGTTPSNTGSSGADTTLGTTLVVAKGGAGGTGSSSVIGGGAGGFSATTGTGDEAPAGNPGMPGRLTASSVDGAISGAGGSSRLGPGAPGSVTGSGAVAGVAATANTGGGGGGATAYNTTNDAAGGAGGSGKMIIIEYLSV